MRIGLHVNGPFHTRRAVSASANRRGAGGADAATQVTPLEGAEYMLRLTQALLNRPDRPEYVTLLPEQTPRVIRQALEAGPAETVTAPNPGFMRRHAGLDKVAAAANVDLLHCVDEAPWTAITPFVLTMRKVLAESHEAPSRGPGFFGRLRQGRDLRRAARIITFSEYSKAQLAALYGVPDELVAVAPPGVDEAFTRIDNPGLIQEAASRLGLQSSYILGMGVAPHRNPEILLQAFRALISQGGVHQTLALLMEDGDDPKRKAALEALAVSLHLKNRVRVVGPAPVEDLPLLLSGAQLFVYPCRAEETGLRVLEAMACGAPLVASNVTALPEVVGDAGLLVDPDEPEALARAMSHALMQIGLRERLQTRGMARARRYGWDRAAAATELVYKDLYISIIKRHMAARKPPRPPGGKASMAAAASREQPTAAGASESGNRASGAAVSK